jgi:hypothetical protein
MKTKIERAGVAAVLLFFGIGVATVGVLVYHVPALAVLFLLGFYAIYENLEHRAKLFSRSDSGFPRKRKAVDLSRRQMAEDLRMEISSASEGWYKNPQLEALMDLGLSVDEARAELARQARYGVE